MATPNGFRFSFTRLDAIPRLAWCAGIPRGGGVIRVWHGAGIECAPDGSSFHEGAWSGDFAAHRFDTALTFTGSGARLCPQGVLFAAATHTLEPIHVMRRANDVLCSNSLHFLLAEAGDSVRLDYPYYDIDIMSIMFGLRRYKRFIPTANGDTVHQYYHCNFRLSPDLEIDESPKPEVPEFRDFATYTSFLTTETAAVTENAAASRRSVRYSPVATISSGYDSPACATIGKRAGCRDAITFATARDDYADRNDCGTPIARALGLDVTEFDFYSGPQQREDYPEVEFIASGHGGDEIPMMVAESAFAGKLLYTGYHGDKVWDKNLKHPPTADIVRGDPSGSSLAEFRLRVGFINLPVVFIGCIRHPTIYAISNSAEMQPWSLGNSYDRPIPRRIVEGAGVARSLFGQTKKAVAMAYLNCGPGRNPPMEEILCEHSYRDFLAFIEPLKRYRRLDYTAWHDAMHVLYGWNQRVVWSGKLRRMLGPLHSMVPDYVSVPEKYARPRSNNSLAFHWAASKMRARYAHAGTTGGDPPSPSP